MLVSSILDHLTTASLLKRVAKNSRSCRESIYSIYTAQRVVQVHVLHEFHEGCHSVTCYFMIPRVQTMLWHYNARVNSHQRWKQTRFRICIHLWCELTRTRNVTEWQVSWNSWLAMSRWRERTAISQRNVPNEKVSPPPNFVFVFSLFKLVE